MPKFRVTCGSGVILKKDASGKLAKPAGAKPSKPYVFFVDADSAESAKQKADLYASSQRLTVKHVTLWK